MNERPEDTLNAPAPFKQRLADAIWEWVRANFKWLVSGFLGLVLGGVGVYLALWMQIVDAKLASAMALKASGDTAVSVAELKLDIEKLVTKREMDVANGRISDLEHDYAVAYHEAGTPPVGKRPRKK